MPFYQQLHSLQVAAPRFAKTKLSAGAVDDLQWFKHILEHGHLSALPVSMFGELPLPSVELCMDASNTGLAVLDPAANKFIQLKFDSEEATLMSSESANPQLSINVREHFCMALALWTWGPSWHEANSGNMIQVKCWSDNMSAVQWCNRLHFNNAFSQEINRAIGLAEVYFNLRVSADHLPGSTNWMADAASRAWTVPYRNRWTNFSVSWQQTPVPPASRKLYMEFSRRFKPSHWPRRPPANTPELGHSGPNGVSSCTFPSGSHSSRSSTPTNLHSSRRTVGNTVKIKPAQVTLPSPCSPSLATSRGIIGGFVATASSSHQATNSPSLACAVTTPPPNPKLPVTFELLQRLHRWLNFESAQHRVIWGASVLGFFFLLRRSEYLADGPKVKPYAIQRADVLFLDNQGREQRNLQLVEKVQIRFRGSKTDQFGEGTSRVMARSGQHQCCPVLASWYLVKHHKAVGANADSLLCKVTPSKNLQVRDVVSAIKAAAESAGKDPDRYGSHSLRSGGATALFNAGFDSLAVKIFGRWKSNAVERYTRIDSRLTSQMAHDMLTKEPLQRYQGATSTPHPGSRGAAMELSS